MKQNKRETETTHRIETKRMNFCYVVKVNKAFIMHVTDCNVSFLKSKLASTSTLGA